MLLFHQIPVHNNATRKVNQQKKQKTRLPLRSKCLHSLRTRWNLHSLNQEGLRRQITLLQLNQGIHENKISQQINKVKINQKSQCLLWPWLHSQVWLLHSTRNQRPVGWQKQELNRLQSLDFYSKMDQFLAMVFLRKGA